MGKIFKDLRDKFDFELIQLLRSTLTDLNETSVTKPFGGNFRHRYTIRESWIFNQIANGTAEVSSETLVLTRDTPDTYHYSLPVDTFRPQLYFKAKFLREDKNLYQAPFNFHVWMAFVFVVAILTLVLTFILKRETELPHEISYDVFARIIDAQEDRDEGRTDELANTSYEALHQKEKWEMSEILLVCLGALCQQGSARDPNTHAARVVFLVFFFLAVLVYTAYSASLFGFISLWPSTEREQNFKIRNLSDLKGLVHNIDNADKYKELNLKNVKKTSLRDGFDKVLNGDAVLLGDRDVSLTFLHSQNLGFDVKCKLGRAHLGIEYQKVLPLKKNSKFKEKINRRILTLKEFGLLQRIKANIFDIRPPCTPSQRSSTNNFVSFNKKDVWPPLRLLTVGIILSILMLMVEKFVCIKTVHQAFVNLWNSAKKLMKKILKLPHLAPAGPSNLTQLKT